MKPMTRKEAIKRLKRIQILSSNEAQAALSLAIRALESLEGGIRVKAWAKKGTKRWYNYDKTWTGWYDSSHPIIDYPDLDEHPIPKDAVLVDIIIVTPKNE
jgi:hypothetical protein